MHDGMISHPMESHGKGDDRLLVFVQLRTNALLV
jgi:hypothetical protein